MTIVIALILAALAYYAWYDTLGPTFTMTVRPLISGFFTGLMPIVPDDVKVTATVTITY